MTPILRWQQADSARHARIARHEQDHAEPGLAFRALCGAVVVPSRTDFIELGGLWLDKTCMDCERMWLATSCTDTGGLLR